MRYLALPLLLALIACDSQEKAAAPKQDVTTLVAQGSKYINEKNPQEALKAFGQALELDITNNAATTGKGISLDMMGSHDAAQGYYKEVLKRAPEHRAAQNNLALSYILSGKYDDAIGILEPLSAKDNSPTTRQNLALAYGLKGDQARALELGLKDLPPEKAKSNLRFYDFYRSNASALGIDNIQKAVPVAPVTTVDVTPPQPAPVEPVQAVAVPAPEVIKPEAAPAQEVAKPAEQPAPVQEVAKPIEQPAPAKPEEPKTEAAQPAVAPAPAPVAEAPKEEPKPVEKAKAEEKPAAPAAVAIDTSSEAKPIEEAKPAAEPVKEPEVIVEAPKEEVTPVEEVKAPEPEQTEPEKAESAIEEESQPAPADGMVFMDPDPVDVAKPADIAADESAEQEDSLDVKNIFDFLAPAAGEPEAATPEEDKPIEPEASSNTEQDAKTPSRLIQARGGEPV